MIPEQTELIEKLNCLECETAQLNHAYQLWSSYVEQGTVPDWMAAAIRITCDAVITLCFDPVSTLALGSSHAGEIECYGRNRETAFRPERAFLAEDSITTLCLRFGQRLQCDAAETAPGVGVTALVDFSPALAPTSHQNQIVGGLTTEQTELFEKVNYLEFETSQLNHAYQLWRSYVEQGTTPDWMAAAIRVTYEALITFFLNTVSPLPLDTDQTGEMKIECYAPSDEIAPQLKRALLTEENITTLCIRNGHLQCDDAEAEPAVPFTAMVDGSLALTPVRQHGRIAGVLTLADVHPAFSIRKLAQLEAATCEISAIVEVESETAELSPELLPTTEPAWSEPEMQAVLSLPSTDYAPWEQPATEEGEQEQEEEAGAEPASMYSLATLRLPNWLQGSSIKLFGVASVAILLVAGAAMGIYVASPQRAPSKSDVRLREAGTVAIPSGEKGEFKFDPDPVVARPGSPFVLNAVLSRGSDVASVAVEIDYDANLLQFKGVSQGGFLVKAGPHFILAQRDDPLTGILKINAEQSPGTPGISGDGPVFALSFQARKKGKATVSIVPGGHDSQGRRIEMAGSQVSVTIH